MAKSDRISFFVHIVITLIPGNAEARGLKNVSGGGGWARLSNEDNGVIRLAKPKIFLIKAIRTTVWETIVMPLTLIVSENFQLGKLG